jgi:hypothetical protein
MIRTGAGHFINFPLQISSARAVFHGVRLQEFNIDHGELSPFIYL